MTTMPVTVQERVPMPMEVTGRPTGAGAGWSFGDVVRVLRQRVYLILFLFLLTMGATVGLTYYWQREFPSWRADAVVYVESTQPKTPLEFGERPVQVDLMNRFVADQVVLLTDDSLLRELLKKPAIRETQWFQSQRGKTDGEKVVEALKELKDDLAVAQIPDSSYMRVSFRTRVPEDAPVIVNGAVTEYLARVHLASEDEWGGELKDYEKTRSQLEERLNGIRSEKQRFLSSQLGVPGLTEGLNVVGETWRALAAEVTRLEAEKLQYQAAYDNLRGVDPDQILINPESRSRIEDDPRVWNLRNMLRQLEHDEQVLAQQGLGEQHRQVKSLHSQVAVVEQQLVEMLGKLEAEVREYQLYQTETMYLNATQAELQLRERMLESEAKQRDIDRGLAEYRRMEEEQAMLEEQYKQLSDYTTQLNMILQARGTVRVRSIGQAQVPDEMYRPRWEYNLPAGFVVGILLAVGVAMLLELADTSVRTSRDVLRHVHVPILGTVPDLDDEELPIENVELACHTAPRSMIAEAFRTIRTNLLLSSPAERQRSVLVTSAKPEEGKTSVAVNLAISVAQGGRRVLLVDANFHRPTLHRLFPKSRREGLSNILIGQARVADLASRTDLPNLDVLTSGPIPPNPTELLAGTYLHDMITQATERYDQIIFDGPPVLLVSDVLVMTGSVDGVVLVCRARSSSRGTVQRAREQIERVHGHIFGAVLNAAQVTRGGYFREQIRTYYDYQSEEALASQAPRALPREDESQDSDSSEA